MSKLSVLVAGGVGYVLGARAGRERYEQIQRLATRVKENPTVQDTARQATEAAKDAARDAAPVVKQKVSEAASAAAGKVGRGESADEPEVPLDSNSYPAPGAPPPTRETPGSSA